jgi:hypothetical protein
MSDNWYILSLQKKGSLLFPSDGMGDVLKSVGVNVIDSRKSDSVGVYAFQADQTLDNSKRTEILNHLGKKKYGRLEIDEVTHVKDDLFFVPFAP